MTTTVRQPEKKRAPARDQGRVLVVAEDPRVRGCAAGVEAGGLFVSTSEGGTKSLIALRRTRPHVVVADVGLKGVSAQDLVRVLADAQEAVPVVLAGGEPATLERRAAAMGAGASDYFQLPAESALLVARVGQLAAYKLSMDRLRAEADRDYLTGLANRRRFRKALGQEVERWRRYQIPCSLLMLDVDHMKRINDGHGHPAGDRVIRYVASALTELSRDNDTAARLGGEEFALLLAGVGGEKAFAAAERLREDVCAGPLEEVGTVTISVGVAACPAHASSERELFAASDAALYRAKREGRNRSVAAELIAGQPA
ncbi:MAG TPA: diguanylate cyclase [Pyrinomonadaceae bacterium]|nr:diguanylate cyclase [Pyrinomonadaceae bacterium]